MIKVIKKRYRVRALQELNQNEISAIKEDMTKSEALKFVRDTAVKRRTLNKNQKLNVVLNTKDLIEELQEKSKENRLANLKQNKPKSPVEPIGKKVKTPVKENAELAKLAGVSETTLKRAKKVKKISNIGRTKMFNQKYVLKNECVKSTHTKKFMCYYSKMSMRFGFSKKEQPMYTVKNDHVLLLKNGR
ncbi:hypothetical protein NQ040_05400 [Staphylococcus cohnii]|nr:hypothetical protein [Staphylococcus cohnii]